MKTRILLVGCGYTSVWTYRNLSGYVKRAVEKGEVEIVLLSETPHHHFHGFTGEFLSGHLSVELSYNHYSSMMKHVQFIHGTLTKVNQNANSVEYRDFELDVPQTLEYDQLVLGIGSIDHDRNIPGLYKYGYSVKKPGGIAECRQKIYDTIKLAAVATSEEERKKLLSFVVAGGGYAGVELAGNLCEMLEYLKNEYPVLQQGYQVHLVISGDRILPQVDDKFGRIIRYTQKKLEQYQLNILYSTRVTEVEEHKISLNNGEVIDAPVFIYAIGQKRVSPDSEVPFDESKEKTIHVDETLRAVGFDNIWVGGDIACAKHPFDEKPNVANALWAMMHGTQIGKNVSRAVRNKKPRKFLFPGLGQTASVGKHKGVLELYNMQFTGTLAWYLRLGFFLYFYPVRKHLPTILKELYQNR